MDKKKIILIGGGGHCKACIDVVEQTEAYQIVGIIDMPEKVGEKTLGYPVIGTDEQIPDFKEKTDEFLITLGQIGLPKQRKDIYEFLKKNSCKLATVISPLAYISQHASIGEGSIVMHGALVNADAKIGNNCIINTKALVEHDAIIEDNCHVATAAIINGGVRLGADSFFGSNAVSKQYISIAKESFIKANSVEK